MSEIHVSPIDGLNVLLVNGFRITIEPVGMPDNTQRLEFVVSRKGKYIYTYLSLQQAVEWCSD